MIRLPQPIPYQGSKRNIASSILRYIPHKIERMVEPFAGSAAMSIAASAKGVANSFLLNDLNHPLASLLQLIINQPSEIADKYAQLWNEQLGRERGFYDEVRARFNTTKAPELLLYLLARCVKASVRYNSAGEFNQSPDNRRKGRHPASMRSEILDFSRLLRGKSEVIGIDFRQTINLIDARNDFVYLDPPYQGTSGNRDARYLSGVTLSALVDYLEHLNRMDVLYALSYDGIKGEKMYGEELPKSLNLHKVLLNAGRSTQSTLIGRNDITYESLYLSPVLVKKLNVQGGGIAMKYPGSANALPSTLQMALELEIV